jgi:mono/diheme cytochrome c family protein
MAKPLTAFGIRGGIFIALVGVPSLAALFGCDDARIGPDHSEQEVEVIEKPTLCDVSEQVFEPQCTACHGEGGTPPILTLEAARTSIVGVESTVYPGSIFVVPNDPGASFLLQKMKGSQEDRGASMPLGRVAENDASQLVENWIADGAKTECDAPAADAGPEPPPPDAGPSPGDGGASPDDGGNAGGDGGMPPPGPDAGTNLHCAVQALFDAKCISCHSQAGTNVAPLLDAANAETDLLLQPSPNYPGTILLIPHYPDASLLYRKSAGTQTADEGAIMPPAGAPLEASEVETMRQWIEEGAAFDCP